MPNSLFDTLIKKRLLSGGAWATGGMIATALLGISVNVFLARLLTPEDLGSYFLIFSIVSVAVVLSQMGLKKTLVRLVAESLGANNPGRARAAIQKVILYGSANTLIVSGLFTSGIGYLMAKYIFKAPVIEKSVDIIALWIVVIAIQELLVEIFRAFHDIRLATLLGRFSKNLLSALFFGSVWLLYGHTDLRQVIILSITAGLTSVILSSVLLRPKIQKLGQKKVIASKEILTIAWPLLITNLSLLILSQSNIWILGAFCSQEDVALYGASARLVTMVAMSLSIVNAIAPPLITELHAKGKKKELEHFLRFITTLAGLPAFLGLLCFIIYGETILSLIFGDYYRQGATVLAVLSLGGVANVWTGTCSLTLMMTNHHKTVMQITSVRGIIAIVGGIWVVQDYGITGVAVISTVSLIFQNIFTLFMVKKRLGIWTHAVFSPLSIKKMLNSTMEVYKTR